MRPQLVLLLGVLALAVPAVPLGFLLREPPATPRVWAKSPPEPPYASGTTNPNSPSSPIACTTSTGK